MISKLDKIGRWTVVRESRRETTRSGERVYWLVKCQCGDQRVLVAGQLVEHVKRGTGGCNKKCKAPEPVA